VYVHRGAVHHAQEAGRRSQAQSTVVGDGIDVLLAEHKGLNVQFFPRHTLLCRTCRLDAEHKICRRGHDLVRKTDASVNANHELTSLINCKNKILHNYLLLKYNQGIPFRLYGLGQSPTNVEHAHCELQ